MKMWFWNSRQDKAKKDLFRFKGLEVTKHTTVKKSINPLTPNIIITTYRIYFVHKRQALLLINGRSLRA